MISPARKLCYKLLKKIEANRLFSDDALNSKDILNLEVRDRHLTTEIVYGTLRWQAQLDYVLSGMCSRPWNEVAAGAKILLRMSLYQMWRMDRMPEYALVHDAVELAKKDMGKGIDGFINGILRSLARSKPWKRVDFLQNAPAWVCASLPEWLWDRWRTRYGEAAAMEYALSLNSPPRPALRLTRRCQGAEALQFPVEKSKLVPEAYIPTNPEVGLRTAEDDGIRDYQIQDEASQLVPHLFGPIPGWKIWDSCAAPGGKCAILSKLCGESGLVIATDLQNTRIHRMLGILRSAGAQNVSVLVADASRRAPFQGLFDGVMADVPCSGLGTLRRNPEIKWRFQTTSFITLQETQKRILTHVLDSVRIGGRLLYSTCSTEPEENELVVQSFLDTRENFRLVRPEYPEGIAPWTNPDMMVRTFPSRHLWDGFFAALLERLC